MSPGARIYLDHNAATPLHPDAAAVLRRALEEEVSARAHASSVHAPGRELRARLAAARRRIAAALGVDAEEVLFTASGSESCAMALKGAFRAAAARGRRAVVASGVEHPAVQLVLEQLEREGAQLRRVAPAPDGRVQPEAMAAALGPDVALCTLQWANHETGVLQPVEALVEPCARVGAVLHTDAAQALGKTTVDLAAVRASLASFSASKFGGPVGVGLLVARTGTPLEPLVPGHQEGGRRGGALPVALCEAAAAAAEAAVASLAQAASRTLALRDRLERELRVRLPGTQTNGSAPRVANTSNLRFPGVDAEALFMALDLEGIHVSMGAACASGSLKPSAVLTAMGLAATQARECLRVSLGASSTEADVDALVEALARLVPTLRR